MKNATSGGCGGSLESKSPVYWFFVHVKCFAPSGIRNISFIINFYYPFLFYF